MHGSWPLILALWGAGLGAAMQYAKVSVIYDLLGALYPEGGVMLGWLVSMVGGVGIVLGVVAAMLVARCAIGVRCWGPCGWGQGCRCARRWCRRCR